MSDSADPKNSPPKSNTPQQKTAHSKPVNDRKKKSRKKKRHRKPTKERRSLYRAALTAAVLLLIAFAALWLIRSSPQVTDSQIIRPPESVESVEPAMLLHQWLRVHRDEEVVALRISSGATVYEVCKLVEEKGLLKAASADDLRAYLIKNELDTRIQAGSYILDSEYDLAGIAAILSQGYGTYAVLSLFPGITSEQIDRRLVGLRIAEEGEFLHYAQVSAQSRGLSFVEGCLLPGEYILKTRYRAAQSLAEGMIDAMLEFSDAMRSDMDRSGRSLEQIVIVASMVQRETASSSQMPLIAGIIWNRLSADMPLGIDATTRYETGNWQLPITRAQLRSATPYNTRIQTGLPPTGIGSPGPAALFAAVYPRTTEYFYYLHDREGNIHPAVTYEEHQQNISDYIE